MRARVFLLLCALAFMAATLAFLAVSRIEGRPTEGLLPAVLFAVAFLFLAVRFPEAAGRSCARCGRGRDAALRFCGACGEARP